ncbi:similar to Saccharomyces cerevisiae YDL211C Putative protein of unknown function [Maudiozyma saulgeensis]|uniref:Mid2 domain-containing protein n=1 Tax=Maudiozyma saulgeensis TaxID=1789683 RepID=A0A1X7R2K2_9SACH|nr:similar to Saccharomyces cerevisiae YDL211C Putative protein of unknown function [Kazachstania saulgeensis]
MNDNSTAKSTVLTSKTDTWLPQTVAVSSLPSTTTGIINEDSAGQNSLTYGSDLSTNNIITSISSSLPDSTLSDLFSSSDDLLSTVSSVSSVETRYSSIELSSSFADSLSSTTAPLSSSSSSSSSSSLTTDQLVSIPSTTGSSNDSTSSVLLQTFFSSSSSSVSDSIENSVIIPTLTIEYNDTIPSQTTTYTPTTSSNASNSLIAIKTTVTDPFLSIINAFKHNTTQSTSFVTTKISDSSLNGNSYNKSMITKVNPTPSIILSSSRSNFTVTFNSKHFTSSSQSTRNTTTLQKSSSSSSSSSSYSSSSSASHFSPIFTTMTMTTTSSSNEVNTTSSTELSSSTTQYSYLEDESLLYYIYTQQYDFTDSVTSFTAGFPETITITKPSASGEATTSFTIPSSTITANASLYEKLLNGGALDGSDSSSSSDATKSHSSKVGTIVGSVVGSIGGVIIAVLLLWWFLRNRKNRSPKTTHGYDKSFAHEIHERQGYNATGMLHASSSYADENTLKITTQMDSQMNPPPSKFSTTNPFINQDDTQARKPPPVPLPRKNKMNTLYGPGRQSWTEQNTNSYVSSSAESSFAEDSTLSSSSIRLGSHYDSPSSNIHSTVSHPQGFFREII